MIIGCGGVEQAPEPIDLDPPGADPVPTPPQDSFKLTLIGWQTLNLVQTQQVTLQVLYTKNSEPVGGQIIEFVIKDTSSTDSTLSASKAQTSAAGFAEVTLTAGQLTGALSVVASAERVTDVSWSVVVQENPSTTLPVPSFDGTLGLTSKFDIQTSFTGSKLADVLNILDQISDDPQDPGKFVVDTVLQKIDNQAILAVATLLKPTLYKEVNSLLLAIAPKLVGTLKQLAQDLSTVARTFEIKSTLASPAPQPGDLPLVADHTLKSIAWTLSGQRVEVTFQQINLSDPVVKNVQLTVANGTDLTVRDHTFKLNYGAFLLVALDNLVIPRLEPGAKNITDLLGAHIDCVKVGQTMSKTVGLGGDPLWVGACNLAVKAVGTYLEYEIAGMASDDTSLTIKGQAKLYDTDKSGTYDLLTKGLWSGTLELQKCKAPIAGPANRFWGDKVN